jgi:hypothetical protein
MDLPNPNRSNLLIQVKAEREPIKKAFWKLLVLEILSVALSAALGYAFADAMRSGAGSVVVLIAAGLFFAVSAITGLLTLSRSRRLAVLTLQTLAFIVSYALLLRPETALLVSGGGIIFLFEILGDAVVRREIENRLKVSFFGIPRQKIGKMLTGYLLAGIVLTVPLWSESPLPIPERQFRDLYGGSVKIAATLVPGLKFDASVEEFAESIAKKTLYGNKNFEALPPDQQDKAIREGAAATIAQAEKNLAMHLSPAMPVSDVFYGYLSVMAANWKTSFGNSFIALWIFILFILLRGIGAVLVWLSACLAALFFEGCIAAGAVAVTGESATREHVILT